MKWIIIFLLLLLVSCGGGGKDIPDIYTGTNGVVINFLPETPPKKVLENELFLIGFKMQNDGPTDIRQGVLFMGVESDFVEVMGWDQDTFDMDTQRIDQFRRSFDIDGKTLIHPHPHEGLLTIRMQSRELPDQVETHTSLVTATVCYPYQTILSQDVCIESDLFDVKEGVKVCEAQTITLSSQGAPVAITKIDPTMHPSEEGDRITPHFVITVKNVGGGIIVPEDAMTSCSSSSLDKNDINEVSIRAFLFDKSLSCKPQTFRLDDQGTAEVRCELTSGVEATQDAYKSLLRVELDYGYSQTIHSTMVIQAKR